MPLNQHDQLAEIVKEVHDSPKYAHVALDLVWHVAEIEAVKGRKLKETIKAVKNRLHQVVAVYADQRPRYSEWLARLHAADSAEAVQETCRSILSAHASSRERLDILEEFYHTVLGDLPPISSVLDIACGLNPLAIPFMPLQPQPRYIAIDILEDLAEFLNASFPTLGVRGSAYCLDVTRAALEETVDVALLIKALPCLQQIDRNVGEKLLEGIRAGTIVVSYPVRSLGGGEKGMRTHYADDFTRITADKGWAIERFDFSDELVFRITKPTLATPHSPPEA